MAALQNALNQYKQVGTQGGVAEASPHKLIQMLIDGALDRISIAKGHMERNEVALKGENISKAIGIIDGLRASLDKSADGGLVEKLEALYEYMGLRLVEANIKNSPEILEEVSSLMREIKAGWDGIAEHAAKLEATKQR